MSLTKQYYIHTFGCQMNVADSQRIGDLLESNGYTVAKELDNADLILVNTCSVRDKAEHKVFSLLGRIHRLKLQNPELIVGVCGCMAQRLGEDLLKKAPFVDLVVGTANIHKIPQLVDELRTKHLRHLSALAEAPHGAISDEAYSATHPNGEGRLCAFVPIILGCDNFCSYCVVPYTRGRERSRPLDEVVLEVKNLVATGTREVTLLGQNVNSYSGLRTRSDEKSHADFADLLAALNEVEGLYRIRFATSNPRNFSQKIINAIADLDKVCEWIHLPVQAGDDEVLRQMKRGYSISEYLELVKRIRTKIPNVALTTDVMVGFPGETDEQFDNTCRLFEEIRYDGAFTFEFSPRSGTKAAQMVDQIPLGIKKNRIQKLIDLQYRIDTEINQTLVGTITEVLVESVSEKDSSILSGRTRQNKMVNFPGESNLIGQLVSVKLEEAYLWGFTGRHIE